MPSDKPEPMIRIDSPWMIWCPKHLEPFRKNWPAGYMPASLCLFNQATHDEEIVKAADADTYRLEAVLKEYGPLCCRYPEVAVELVGFAGDDKEIWQDLMQKYGPTPPNEPSS